MSTGAPADSNPSSASNDGRISGPQSPPPEEIRGRSRTRQPSVITIDLDGYHSFNSMGRRFTVEKRWKLVREMGIGAFGAVVSAQDTISGEHVAIKQINRVYDKAALAKRALREITLLRHFQTHPNITGLIDLDALSKHANEIYLFMEPMEADLHQIIRSGQELSSDHIAYFIYQILSAMKFVHACNVIHRDLKPGNILVNATCELRICDFGLARGYDPNVKEDGSERASKLTEYVATRWYRAPEIMLGFDGYNEAIDIWSIGCILGELLQGKPIFQGKDYVDQLKCIFEYLGSPSDAIVKRIARGKARKYVRSLPIYRSKPFKFAKVDEHAIDLMSQMLKYEPEHRITAAAAMEHPWLAAFHDPEEEELLPQPQVFSRWRDIEKLETVEQFRDAIWNEIQDYRAQVRSMAEHSASPTVSMRHPAPSVTEPIVEEEEEPEEPNYESNTDESSLGSLPSAPPPETPRAIALTPTNEIPAAIPRPRKNSQHPDPYATFSRRSSAIFGATQSPYPSAKDVLTYFPTLEDGGEEVAVHVRSRVPSMIDGGQYRHLRTLSTVSIHESAARPGGLAAIAPIGKFVGAKTGGADAPPSTPPTELQRD